MTIPKIGDRIRLVAMPHDPAPIPLGTTGTVTFINEVKPMAFTQIGVNWDGGRTLMLAVPPDEFEVIRDASAF